MALATEAALDQSAEEKDDFIPSGRGHAQHLHGLFIPIFYGFEGGLQRLHCVSSQAHSALEVLYGLAHCKDKREETMSQPELKNLN